MQFCGLPTASRRYSRLPACATTSARSNRVQANPTQSKWIKVVGGDFVGSIPDRQEIEANQTVGGAPTLMFEDEEEPRALTPGVRCGA